MIGRDTSPADQALIEEAFKEICPLTRRDGQRITVDPGDPPENRQAGCHCILDIHNDRRSPHPILSGDPLIVLQRDGWTNSNARHNPPYVSLRHPDSDFDMRYWSEGRPAEQRRRAKPFYLSLAHELCGHVATYVRTDGRETGHRGRYTPLRDRSSHNPAIQTENEIASEHGLPADRGLDVDPDTGQPRPGHRGESFLQARVTGYAHRDTELPAPGASVVTEAARTIQTVRYLHEMELLCQVEGFAYEDEGGQRIARARAGRVREAIDTRMLTLLVPPSPIDPALLCRPVTWAPNLTSIVPGASRRGDDLQRRVHVYLFHSRDAAGS